MRFFSLKFIYIFQHVFCLVFQNWNRARNHMVHFFSHSTDTHENALKFTVGLLWDFVKHDDVIKWKHFPRYWPFVRGIHRSRVNSPHKGQSREALMFSLICVWIDGWINNRPAGDLRRYPAHYDVTLMCVISQHKLQIKFMSTSCQIALGSINAT